MALLSFILALLQTHELRARKRLNLQSVAHLNANQLRDVGLYRVDNHLRRIDDPLALEAELSIKQEAAIKALIALRDEETTNTTGRAMSKLSDRSAG